MKTLIIATRNPHKVQEIAAILGRQFRYLTLRDVPGAPAVVEDADTFAGNAAKKAWELAAHLKWQMADRGWRMELPAFVLADDSGLEVDALNGAPGVHSARFAALDTQAAPATGNSSDADNLAKLLRLLRAVPEGKRAARFRCAIALVEIPSQENPQSAIGNPQSFDGACEGRIALVPAGRGGFGYDPVFVPEGFSESFAELGEDVKNRLSHRARALEKMKAWMART